MRSLVRLACRSCGGPLPARVSWPCVLECPSCGTPLAVSSDDTPPRSAITPSLSPAEAARLALASWRHSLAPPGFPGRPETPRLVFLACFEVERTLASRQSGFVTEMRSRIPAVLPEELGVESLDVEAVLERGERHPYDPREVQAGALVFDPVRSLEIALPPPPGLTLLEQRVEVVFAPVWIVRCQHRGRRYTAAVDATCGRLLEARAPVERSARLGTAVLLLFPVAAAAGLPGTAWPWLGEVAIRMPPLLTLWIVGMAALLVGWAWDRVRFRYEWVEGPSGARLEAVNRPERTWLERISGGLLRMPRPIIGKRARR